MQGAAFDLVQVDLSRKPSWYSSVTPAALVPALALQGATITESIRIARQACSSSEAVMLHTCSHRLVVQCMQGWYGQA